jgi:hypothetical protein
MPIPRGHGAKWLRNPLISLKTLSHQGLPTDGGLGFDNDAIKSWGPLETGPALSEASHRGLRLFFRDKSCQGQIISNGVFRIMVDFDELVAWPLHATHISLGRAIWEIKSGLARPSLDFALYRDHGCQPSIYTMEDVHRFAALPEFKAWLTTQELAIPKEL